jgi:hypothetical protein
LTIIITSFREKKRNLLHNFFLLKINQLPQGADGTEESASGTG